MKRQKIITNNRELYDKLIMLNFSSEVLLRGVRPFQVDKILSRINKESNILISEILDNELILIRKNGPINFDVYLR